MKKKRWKEKKRKRYEGNLEIKKEIKMEEEDGIIKKRKSVQERIKRRKKMWGTGEENDRNNPNEKR